MVQNNDGMFVAAIRYLIAKIRQLNAAIHELEEEEMHHAAAKIKREVEEIEKEVKEIRCHISRKKDGPRLLADLGADTFASMPQRMQAN